MTRLLLLAALAPAFAFAQATPDVAPASIDEPFVVPRLAGPVTLDGRVDEAAWDAVAPLPLVTHWPSFGEAPSEPTEIRLAYDDAYVYLSCRCYAPPEAVFAASFERDLATLGTDYLTLGLDTFSDDESGVSFMTSPTGSRTDTATSGDTGANDEAWNTFWDAEVTVTDEGWFAEMRVPFSSLRFRSDGGRVTMGLSAWRYLGKKNELDIFPAIRPDWGFWSFNKPSQFQTVVFEGVEPRRQVYVTPYALGGMGQSFDLDAAESAYVRADDAVTEIGADVKVGLSDDLTLDLTLNTDFAQVEADAPQVNLTRFSLFFPEQRQFFLERASLFDVGLGGSDRLFYTRRIGLVDGEAVPLLGGGRLVGRVGAWEVGAINLQTGRRTIGLEPDDRLPSENVGVLRVRRPVFNARSTAGAMLTSRVGEDGATNVALGLDADVRVFEESFLSLNAVQTVDSGVEGASPWDTARLRARLERRAYTGTSYSATVTYSGEAYRPGLGFEQRRDYTALRGELSQGWGAGGPFSRHRVEASSLAFLRNADGSTETVDTDLNWDGQFRSGASLSVGANVVREDLRNGFALSDDADVPAGTYTFASARASAGTPGGQPRRASVFAGGGAFYDGWRITAGVSPTWVVSKHLALYGTYELNRIGFPDRDQSFTAHVGRLRVRAALNTRWSLSSVAQVNSAARGGLLNLRLRYNPREGRDIYLVVNEGFNTDRLRASPARPFTSQRAVLAKVTTTFAL
ncbi:carbohydrate binding family 9 domain-containing protein [Rubrivirga marina]|uniref:DUF5916 domain-containing protein n=1 Tax=Rubrivirga marina TaxID=1196024 RepID=A0A271IY50_9BACT|nr:carbohydrate binding family 9 domain-containing protein [Rubrivirga marina]PAP75449.1 hypothetical protein BSZ37_02805 [Rubrivirga marina]